MPATDNAILILAAGNSSRLGTPKQLLTYRNKTLLQHTVDEALASSLGDVYVVTGANHEPVVSSLQNDTVHIVHNEHWQEGMGSSLRLGLSNLLAARSHLQSVLIMLCDQPFVSSSLLQEIIRQKESSGQGIIACAYRQTVGVPVLFANKYFTALLSLSGDEGAKKIITSHAEDVVTVSFPLGCVDIDTKEDYERLSKQ